MFEPESMPYWVPFGIGVGLSARTAYRDITSGAVTPRSWFAQAGASGMAARKSAIAAGLRGAGRFGDAAYGPLISQMGAEAAWRTGIHFTPDQARSAIVEATKASLLRGRTMNPEEVNLAVARLQEAPMKGPGNAFETASTVVRKGGRQRVFYQTMSDFIAGNRIPGSSFSTEAFIDQATGGAVQSNMYKVHSGAYLKEDLGKLLTKSEAATLERVKAMAPKGYGVELASVVERQAEIAQGPIRMAQFRVRAPGSWFAGEFNVPLTEGWMAAGREFENVYATQKIITDVAGTRVSNFSDFYAQRFFNEFLPEAVKQQGYMSQNTWRRMIADYDASVSRYMMWTPGVAHKGAALEAALHRQHLGVPQVVSGMVTPERMLNPDEAYELLYRRGFSPALSPTGLKAGRVFGKAVDLRQDLWGYGSVFPYERRPGQGLRGMSLSPAARQAVEGATFGPGGVFRRDIPFMAPAARRQLASMGVVSPNVMMTYAVGGQAKAALQGAGLEAEEIAMRRSLRGMFETDVVRPIEIDVNMPAGREVRQFIEERMADPNKKGALRLGSSVDDAAKGRQLIGYEPGTGKPIYARDVAGVTQTVEGMEYIGGSKERVRLLVREQYTADSMVKVFNQLKGTAKLRESTDFYKLLDEMGVPNLAPTTDAVAYVDDLRKNRAFLRLQMSSALAEQAAERLQTMKRLAGLSAPEAVAHLAALERISPMAELESFVANTTRNAMASQWTWGGAAEAGIIQQARAWQMPNVGFIGGLIPEMQESFTQAELAQITRAAGGNLASLKSEVVRGTAALSPGDYPHFMGGGNRGSIEPRGFSQLLEHKWNVSGGYNVAKGLAGEMARSMESFGEEIRELNRIADTLGGGKISGAPTVGLTDAMRGQLVRGEGYTLDLGQKLKALGGGSQIYVPGESAIRQLGYFRTDPGTLHATALTSELETLANAAQNARRARNAEDLANAVASMESAAGRVRTSVSEAIGIATYGRGGDNPLAGALRGKMVGSKNLYLQGMGPVSEETATRTVRVSELSAKEMLDDLARNAGSDAERAFVEEQRRLLFQEGKAIAGTVGRHPMIGPYSIQPAWIELAKTPESATTHFAQASSRTTFSMLKGMAADYDGDRLVVKMIGDRKVASATAELLTGGTFQREYEQFVAEASTLTNMAKKRAAGGAAGILSNVEAMITGSMKLRIGAVETGVISEAMTKAKLATSTYASKLAPRFNLMAEILEQQIISGKHMSGTSVAALQEQNIARRFSENIMSAATNVENRQAIEALVNDTRNILGPEIESGITAKMAGREFTIQQDLTKMWESVTESMRRGYEPGGILSEYSSLVRRQGLQGEYAIGEVQEAIRAGAEGRSHALMNLAMRGAPSEAAPMQIRVSQALSRINKGIQEAGAAARRWGKPALIGLAATAGAALLLGGPKPTIMEPPSPTLMGGRNHGSMTPEDMPVPEGVSGQPTAPGMATPSAYLTQSARPGQRIVARANAHYAPDYDSVVNALRPIAGSGNARITFHDNRRKLTPDRIESMMEGY